MAGQPARLTIPRLDRPGTKTPAGGSGSAGATSIYSVESPGGFWLLGRTPFRLYDPAAAEPILLRAGDRVRFRPIDAASFDALAAEVAAGSPPDNRSAAGDPGVTLLPAVPARAAELLP